MKRMSARVFRRKSAAVALSAALVTMAPVSAALATLQLPSGQTDVVLNLQGTSVAAGQWSGTVNGEAIASDTSMKTGIYQAQPEGLKSLTVNYEGFSEKFGAFGVVLSEHSDIAIAINSRNLAGERTKALNSYIGAYFMEDAQHSGTIRIDNQFQGMDLQDYIASDKKRYGSNLTGLSDRAATDATYDTIKQSFSDIKAVGLDGKGEGAGIILATDFRKGNKRIGTISESFSDVTTASVYGVYANDASLDIGSLGLTFTDVQTDLLFGLYSSNKNLGSSFVLRDGLQMTMKNVSADQFVGMFLRADSMTVAGDILIQAQDCDFSTDSEHPHTALFVNAADATNPLLIQGDIAFDVRAAAEKTRKQHFDISAVDIQHVGKTSDVILDGSHVSLSLNGVTSPRIRALMIRNEALQQGSLILRNGADVSLTLENVNSGTGENSEDPPSAILLGTNAKLQMTDATVNVTLRAHEGNAFNNQSLFGVLAQKTGTGVSMDANSHVTVTLEGQADLLGLGKASPEYQKPIQESGSIYGVGLHADATHDIKGDIVLQLGSEREKFTSDQSHSMGTAFGNFTHVALSEGSTLFIDKTQSSVYQGDTEMGTSPEFKYGKSLGYGILASEGVLSVTAEKDKNVGLVFGDSSAITADTVDFKSNAEGAGSTVVLNGQGTLSGKKVSIAQGSSVAVTLGDGVAGAAGGVIGEGLENRLLIQTESAEGFENNGTLVLNDANVEFNNQTDGVLHLGDVQTTGTQGYSHVLLGAGEYVFESFSGQNKALVLTDMKANQGVEVNAEGDLSLVATGASNDQYVSVEEAAQALVDKVKVEGGQGTLGTVQAEVLQGALNDAMTATVDTATGTLVDKVVQKNTTFDALGSVSALTLLQWRHEMSDLTRRMGELRDTDGNVGGWVRTYGSEQKYGGQHLTAKHASVQVGSDVRVGENWIVGAAFNYTDGSMKYALGSGDTKNYGLGVYATWLAESGAFVDLIAKYNRLSSDVSLGGNAADFDNNALSLSAEFGWHAPIGSLGFVEPQVQMSYGRIFGKDFTLSNQVKMSQDDMQSLIARAGLRAGVYFPENKGTLYAHASVLHDFKGDFDVTGRLAGRDGFNYVSEDLGGTWYEMGIGANFNVTDNTYTYVDLSKTCSGEVQENWRWNIGVRHAF